MTSVRKVFLILALLGSLTVASAAQASSRELESLLSSPAGRFILAELAAPDAAAFIRWAERSGMEARVLQLREEYSRRYPNETRIFERRGISRLSLEQEDLLRATLQDRARGLLDSHIEFVAPIADRPLSLNALAERFLGSRRALPKGGVYPIAASRRDLFGGFIHRVSFDQRSWDPRYLLRSPLFEQGFIRDAMDTLPDLFAPLGFRRVEVDGRVWFEFPDAVALNARMRVLRGYAGDADPFLGSFQFEAFDGNEAPIIAFSEMIARRTVPVGANGRYLKHDVLVHGLAYSRLIHRRVAEAISRRFALVLGMYRDPRFASCGNCRIFFKKVLEHWSRELERQSSILLVDLINARELGDDAAFERVATRVYLALLKSEEGLLYDLRNYRLILEGKAPNLPKGGKYLEDADIELISRVVADRGPEIRAMALSGSEILELGQLLGRELRLFLEPYWRGQVVPIRR